MRRDGHGVTAILPFLRNADCRRSDALTEGRFRAGALFAGRFRIIALQGRGGMGQVYRAQDLELGQPVALKFLTAFRSDQRARSRLRTEVRLARQISHPNVCRVYDIGEATGELYLSMEYVDGEDLAGLLKRIGRLPADKGLDIARKLCAGLAAAHARGVLHRDLKPGNIMIDSRGEVRIMDFGLAAVAEQQLDAADVRSGTPAYMAPEQLEGREATTRSDIYALGLVLYELFTGRPAFEGKDAAELLRLRSAHPSTTPSTLVPDLEPVGRTHDSAMPRAGPSHAPGVGARSRRVTARRRPARGSARGRRNAVTGSGGRCQSRHGPAPGDRGRIGRCHRRWSRGHARADEADANCQHGADGESTGSAGVQSARDRPDARASESSCRCRVRLPLRTRSSRLHREESVIGQFPPYAVEDDAGRSARARVVLVRAKPGAGRSWSGHCSEELGRSTRSLQYETAYRSISTWMDGCCASSCPRQGGARQPHRPMFLNGHVSSRQRVWIWNTSRPRRSSLAFPQTLTCGRHGPARIPDIPTCPFASKQPHPLVRSPRSTVVFPWTNREPPFPQPTGYLNAVLVIIFSHRADPGGALQLVERPCRCPRGCCGLAPSRFSPRWRSVYWTLTMP